MSDLLPLSLKFRSTTVQQILTTFRKLCYYKESYLLNSKEFNDEMSLFEKIKKLDQNFSTVISAPN